MLEGKHVMCVGAGKVMGKERRMLVCEGKGARKRRDGMGS